MLAIRAGAFRNGHLSVLFLSDRVNTRRVCLYGMLYGRATPTSKGSFSPPPLLDVCLSRSKETRTISLELLFLSIASSSCGRGAERYTIPPRHPQERESGVQVYKTQKYKSKVPLSTIADRHGTTRRVSVHLHSLTMGVCHRRFWHCTHASLREKRRRWLRGGCMGLSPESSCRLVQ
jgi:hypothetical protein